MSAFELVPVTEEPASGGWEMVPIEPEKPSVLRNVALNNPLTAVGETALNLGSQAAGMPVAGLAGLGAAAGKALGLTDKDPADVVHSVGETLTYQPRGELGKAGAELVSVPFQKLHEGATWAGDKVLDATDSPAAATAVATMIEGILPMAVAPGAKAIRNKAGREVGGVAAQEIPTALADTAVPNPLSRQSLMARGLLNNHASPSPELLTRLLNIPETEARAHLEAWRIEKGRELQNDRPVPAVPSRVQRLDGDETALPQPETEGLPPLRRAGDIGVRALDDVREFPGRHGEEAISPSVARSAGREWELRTDELPVAGTEVPHWEPARLSQADAGRTAVELGRGRSAEGNLSEHPAAPDPEARGDLAERSVTAEEAARSAGVDRVAGEAPEHRGMGARIEHSPLDTRGEVVPPRNPGRARHGAGATFSESVERADRILKEGGGVSGWINHYNRHVSDGRSIESYARNPDGSFSLRVTEYGKPETVRMSPGELSSFIDSIRDPAKVAEMEARNYSDVVLGRKVRDLDDTTLERWQGMVAISDTARSKLAREAKRRDAESAVRGASDDATALAARIDEAAHEAATSPLNGKPVPTPAQIEAGNYAKGSIKLHGLPITIENPKGSVRKGVSPEGKPWKTEMQHHYGYIKRSMAKDGDPVDVFIGERPASRKAFVIDQIDPRTGRYDEPKVILGAVDQADARRIYLANYEPGWKGLGAIAEMDIEAFRKWADSPKARKPVALRRVAGKAVTEFDAAALARMEKSKTFSAKAQETAAAEIERRRNQLESEPVRAQAGEAAETQAMASPVQNSYTPGANYVGFIDDAPRPGAGGAGTANPANTPSPGSRMKPIRREDVLVPFMKALDAPIYEGRIKGKGKLGHYRLKLEEVRIKRKSDLETAAHELAHLIDDRVPEIRAAYRDKALAAELKSVSYDQKSVKEGFAEFVRLYMTQPELAAERAPAFAQWFDGFVQRHEYGPAIQKAREGMTAWFGQEAIDRARSKIGMQKPINEALDGIWDRFRQSTVDDLHGVYRMERDLKGGIEKLGAYETTRLSRASHSMADGALRWGAPYRKPDGSIGYKGRGLEEILKPVAKNLDDALMYFVGRSSGELLSQGREHLFTRGEIDAMLQLETPERKKAFADYQEWNRSVLDFAEAAGVINPEARALWQRTQYLPFHRVGQPGGLKGKPGEWSGVKALTGGTENIRDVLKNMTANAAMLIDKAVKNEARQRIAELAEQPGGARFMVKIDTEARPVKISGDQVLDAMLKRYGIAVDGDAPAFFEFMIHGQPPAGGNVVAVMKSGKPVWYEVADPLLYRALSSIDRPVQSEVVQWLGLPKRIGQATITATPDFWMANISRDTLMGSVMSRAGFRPVIDSLQGMRLRLTNDPLYKEFVANGGGMSSIFLDETRFRARLDKFYQSQGIEPRAVLDAPGKVLNFIETLGDAFEMSTRLGEYGRAIKAGEHPRHAAYLGREVSTDFAMKGDSKALGFMYDTVMFLRPALVSWDRLGRGLAHDQNKGAIAAKAGSIAMMSAALYMLNRDDPRYIDMADWKKDSYWHFFVGDQHFMWPKIWEVGSVASLAERTVEKVVSEDPAGLGKDFARIIGNTFHLNLMPQIAAPLYEQATNTNSFTKGKIETPGMENLQPFLRTKPGTSETMRAMGMATAEMPEALQVNPVRAEALLRGYFNTWAMYGLMLSDAAMFGDTKPAMRTDELPVVRRFYADDPDRHTRYETEFYEMLGEAKRLRGTLKELDELGRTDLADRKDASPLAGEAKPLERAAKSLRGINNESETVRRDMSRSPEEKRQQLDALTTERNALFKETVTAAKAAQKENAK